MEGLSWMINGINENKLRTIINEEYWTNQKSLRVIGKILKCDGTTILYYMKKFNISRRTRTEIQIGKFREKARGWKGGRRKNSNNYILIYNPLHYQSDINGYIREHRLVMEQHLGRYLTPEEIVHHKNEKRNDNRFKNLRLFPTKNAHRRFHRELKNEKM